MVPCAHQCQKFTAVVTALPNCEGFEINRAAFVVDVVQAVGVHFKVLAQGVGPTFTKARVEPFFRQAAAVGALPVQADQAGQGAVHQLQQFLAVEHADGLARCFRARHLGATGALGIVVRSLWRCVFIARTVTCATG